MSIAYSDDKTNIGSLNEPLYGATFKQASVRFFKKYTKFSGYASLSEFWWATLMIFIVSLIFTIPMIIGMLLMAIGAETTYSTTTGTYEITQGNDGLVVTGTILVILSGILLIAWCLVTIVPSLSITWRRLHDAGFSGLFFFLSFIPSIGGIILLILNVLPTRKDKRRIEWEQ